MKSQYDTVYYSDNFCIEENNLPNRALLEKLIMFFGSVGLFLFYAIVTRAKLVMEVVSEI